MDINKINKYSKVLITNNFLLSFVKIFEIFEKFNDFEKNSFYK